MRFTVDRHAWTDRQEVTIRARAFTGSPLQTVRCLVENGTVLVWDEVAGHYTRCHSLCKGAQRRALRAAKVS